MELYVIKVRFSYVNCIYPQSLVIVYPLENLSQCYESKHQIAFGNDTVCVHAYKCVCMPRHKIIHMYILKDQVR